VPVDPAASKPSHSSAARELSLKIAMGVLWIGVVGWFLIGSILAWSIGMFSSNPAVALLGPVAGVGIGIALYNRWRHRRSAKP
jgi:hypothetical protein